MCSSYHFYNLSSVSSSKVFFTAPGLCHVQLAVFKGTTSDRIPDFVRKTNPPCFASDIQMHFIFSSKLLEKSVSIRTKKFQKMFLLGLLAIEEQLMKWLNRDP
eukprot:TRINITY_DN7917_c0_g1_i9.p1 TRINITY_DN7917_c0_g1~~TRINITY_DN7917_c0_g1_i9.p1  ORF type:complete len:103 (-),score=14.55 TRINITY_DN7917_c0_g1_i9:419-727(-)